MAWSGEGQHSISCCPGAGPHLTEVVVLPSGDSSCLGAPCGVLRQWGVAG